MAVTVERVGGVRLGKRDGLTTLAQSFRFVGAEAEALAEALWTKPLIGPESLFGPQKRATTRSGEGARHLRDFSPAPTFLFDVEMRRPSPHDFVVRFSQPGRARPYLEGEILWRFVDASGGAVLEEHINTPPAIELASRPLTGAKRSLRRWLFFRVGHAQVMAEMTRNLAQLV